jgi:F-type H+-transporting ATPase subunit b
VYEAVDFREDMAIFTAVVFLLLLAGLYATAWKPIMNGLAKREHTITSNMQAAERAALDAQAKLREYEAKLAAAAEEATRMVAEARKDAEAAGARIITEAQDEAARSRERAIAEIDAAKRAALSDLANKSTDVAMTLAQRIIGREVKAADHQNLIQDMLSQLPSHN